MGSPHLLEERKQLATNGRSDQNTNQGVVNQYKRTTFNANVILPDAPIGEWEATAIKGKAKVKATQNGDPYVLFSFRLDKAADEENEFAQGTVLTKMLVLGGDTSKLPAFAKRNTKLELRALANQAGFDLDIVPQEVVESDEDTQEMIEARLRPFIDAVEGNAFTIWTTHRDDKRNLGQKQVDIHFSKPGSAFGAPAGLAARDSDDE